MVRVAVVWVWGQQSGMSRTERNSYEVMGDGGLYVMYIDTQGVHGSSFIIADVSNAYKRSCKYGTRGSFFDAIILFIADELILYLIRVLRC